jgi:hypothetical protein
MALYAVRDGSNELWVTECAWCGRVRSRIGDWKVLSVAARSVLRAQRTHGICPDCARVCEALADPRDEHSNE